MNNELLRPPTGPLALITLLISFTAGAQFDHGGRAVRGGVERLLGRGRVPRAPRHVSSIELTNFLEAMKRPRSQPHLIQRLSE